MRRASDYPTQRAKANLRPVGLNKRKCATGSASAGRSSLAEPVAHTPETEGCVCKERGDQLQRVGIDDQLDAPICGASRGGVV